MTTITKVVKKTKKKQKEEQVVEPTQDNTSSISEQLSSYDYFKELQSRGYICDKNFSSKVKSAMLTKPSRGAFLFGPAGTGKSYLPEVIKDIIDYKMFFAQCFPGTREEDLIVKPLPSETSISGVSLTDGIILRTLKYINETGNPAVLVLDEWDKTRPSADAFLLDFLQTGRVDFNGIIEQADLDKLIIFLTMNDERDLSEPLLRRLPKIDFPLLSPQHVKDALENTHKGHPYIQAAVTLYARCLAAELAKPCTIQELRQLLDATTALGKDSDWDTLVFQYVTKTDENHIKLKSSEDRDIASVMSMINEELDKSSNSKLKSDLYNADNDKLNLIDTFTISTTPSLENLSMPFANTRIGSAKDFDKAVLPLDKLDLEKTYGMCALSLANYNSIAAQLFPTKQAGKLEDFAHVTIDNDTNMALLSFITPLYFTEFYFMKQLWGQEGEVTFIEPKAKMEDIKKLVIKSSDTLKIAYYTEDEVIVKGRGMDVRWTEAKGLEAIVDISQPAIFFMNFTDFNKGNMGDPHDYDFAGSDRVFKPDSKWLTKGTLTMRSEHRYAKSRNYRVRNELESKKIYLGKGSDGLDLHAYYVTGKPQIDKPDQSDFYSINSTIYLPATSNEMLHGDLQFKDRLFIYGQALIDQIGQDDCPNNVSGKYRSVKKSFIAKTEEDVIVLANTYTHAELVKLIAVLRRRRARHA